ncbi:hypothetical protein SAMN02787118_107129 [Streptomyces mirabilis]|uniref:Uncharacterized protein n=1 Tax=Streptomyces mirabilis TaxID=68239 RepID=A0A1I2IZH6_9ACTN|nr:hypothetical protein SAMN02787118_107129 [Streptomyces mirabilis]
MRVSKRVSVRVSVRVPMPGWPCRVSPTAYGSVPVPYVPGGASPSGPLTRAYPTGTG